MTDAAEDTAELFYFESDHLALKGNTDYLALIQCLVRLENKKIQAIADIDTLLREKERALDSPLQFAEKLRSVWLNIDGFEVSSWVR